MRDHIDNYEGESQQSDSLGDDYLPEDRENLQKAMTNCVEIFNAPGQADSDDAFEVVEALEELHLSFSDAEISDQVGELIEILHDVCDKKILSFEDAQRGKKMVQNLAQCCGLCSPHFDV